MMSLTIFSAIVAAASALQITEPASGAQWDLSKTNEIKWAFVSTDEAEFSLQLIDKSTTPETAITIADKVKTSEGEYEFTNFAAKPGDKYTIKAFSVSKLSTGQLAESQTFNVTKSGVVTTTTSVAPSSTGSGTETGAAVTGSAGANAASAIGGRYAFFGSFGVALGLLF
ncbi:hypothetical protein OQA88_2710 [Cercophora sp. LCS_1]